MNISGNEVFDAGFDCFQCGTPVVFHHTFLGDDPDDTAQLEDDSNWTILFQCACPYKVLVCDAGRDQARIPHFQNDWQRSIETMRHAGARSLMVAQDADGPHDAPYFPEF